MPEPPGVGMSAGGYRFSAQWQRELEAAVAAQLRADATSVLLVAAEEYRRDLAAARERRPSGPPVDPQPAA
ncbi:hypothetical protein ACIQWR_12905 [Streptomyces sp. NPDC098789]|uniref:hypothetical protein n=1 Tax=Streptomyces sp. NPDC098789 TaxID=3366098 RepID=UPI0037FFC7FC